MHYRQCYQDPNSSPNVSIYPVSIQSCLSIQSLSIYSESIQWLSVDVLTNALHCGRAGGLASLVVRPARVVATVLRIHWRDLEDDEAEVTERAEPAGCLQRPAVVVPLGLYGDKDTGEE